MTATIELTEHERALLDEMPRPVRPVIGAFRQAMADLGVPPHPDGQCPPPPRPCREMEAKIEARARQLLDDPDIEPCIDCYVPLPIAATCYAVDGPIVCGPCGKRRYGDRAGEYLINES